MLYARWIFTAALMGCGQYKIGNRVDARSPGYDTVIVQVWGAKVAAAGQVWADALGPGCPAPFPVTGDGPPLPVTLYTPDRWKHPGAIGFAPADYIEVRGPTPGDGMGLLIDVLIHEYGHILGLVHNSEPTSVMGPRLLTIPSAKDVRRARELLGC